MHIRRISLRRAFEGRRAGHRAAGFTLIEVLVTLLITTEVMLAILMLVDSARRVSTTQTLLAEMQIGQRIAMYQLESSVKLSGRGKVALGNLPNGNALAVQNNVAAGTKYSTSDGKDYPVLGDTDMLRVRGVIRGPIWVLDTASPAHFTVDDSDPTNIKGELQIPKAPLPSAILGNNVDYLQGLKDKGLRVPLMLTSLASDSVYAVVEFDPDNSNLAGDPAIVKFKVTGGTYSGAYLPLSSSGGFPADLDKVRWVGVLDEYNYYIRMANEIEGDVTSPLAPRLASAHVLAGTNVPIEVQDLAKNVIDLQVSFGVDFPAGIALGGDSVATDSASSTDEWIFNHPDDDPANPSTPLATSTLEEVRVTTITLSATPDPAALAPTLQLIEDHDYTGSAYNTGDKLRYRRLIRSIVVATRNL